jgi:type II secretory pathway component PulC
LVLYSCGGSISPVAPASIRPTSVAQKPSLPTRPKNTLYRDEVERAKSAGLGHFFEHIELEPRGEIDDNGRMVSFEGFQIVALRPANAWLSFDFAPGDLLTHVNGISVEHYSTWYSQFEALPKAEQIRVDLIRDGKPKTIIVRIVDRTAVPPPARAPSQ